LPKGIIIKTGSGIFNPLNAELNPICHLVALLAHHILHVGKIRVNTLLNKLGNVMPELHFPGYNYCGPFMKLDKRLVRREDPVHKLDAGCKEHDIFYHDDIDTEERHIADKELENIANERMHANDASIDKKLIQDW